MSKRRTESLGTWLKGTKKRPHGDCYTMPLTRQRSTPAPTTYQATDNKK
jgi:hypothetical protein